jgi:hypothetical protein
LVDPKGLLELLSGDDLVHTEENKVSYFEMIADENRKKRYLLLFY